MYDLAIVNGKVWIDQAFHRTNIYVLGGKIAALSAARFDASETINATNQFVIPGIIDPHVHFALGSKDRVSVDDFDSGTLAGAHGGVTTIIDFLDPASNVEELTLAYAKRQQEAKGAHVDYRFHATIKRPSGSLEDFVFKMEQLGLTTLKLFTTYSDSGRRTDDDAIKTLLKLTTRHPFKLLAHIENDQMIDLNPNLTYQLLPWARPPLSESEEAIKLAGYVQETGGTLYMVHLSSGDTLEKLITRYPDIINQRFYIESCPHYFTFTQDALSKSDGYLYTMAPPLRSLKEQNKLKEQIDDIHCIGTDHCSYNIAQKHRQLIDQIPLGIGGIEHSFVMMHSLFGDKVIDKMTANVADIHGLPSKGKIKLGLDADFAIFENRPPYSIRSSHTRADNDLYLGMRVTTKLMRTILRGKTIVSDDCFLGSEGQYVKGVIISG
jgi:dihydropyrimidinase